MRRVRRCGHEGRELVEPDASAGTLELPALLELVDERDRVHRLALRVEGERGAVDLRVAVSVKVGGVEDFADRPDRAGGEQHRPEDGFLGLEVLGRRDRSGFEPSWATGCHVARVDHWRALRFQVWTSEFSTCQKR